MAGNHYLLLIQRTDRCRFRFLVINTGEGQTSPQATGSLICQLTRFSQGHRWGCLLVLNWSIFWFLIISQPSVHRGLQAHPLLSELTVQSNSLIKNLWEGKWVWGQGIWIPVRRCCVCFKAAAHGFTPHSGTQKRIKGKELSVSVSLPLGPSPLHEASLLAWVYSVLIVTVCERSCLGGRNLTPQLHAPYRADTVSTLWLAEQTPNLY